MAWMGHPIALLRFHALSLGHPHISRSELKAPELGPRQLWATSPPRSIRESALLVFPAIISVIACVAAPFAHNTAFRSASSSHSKKAKPSGLLNAWGLFLKALTAISNDSTTARSFATASAPLLPI